MLNQVYTQIYFFGYFTFSHRHVDLFQFIIIMLNYYHFNSLWPYWIVIFNYYFNSHIKKNTNTIQRLHNIDVMYMKRPYDAFHVHIDG
jgi:hypothetical protein